MYGLMALLYNCAERFGKPVSILSSNWLHWKWWALGVSWKADLACSTVPAADTHSVYEHHCPLAEHSYCWERRKQAARGGKERPVVPVLKTPDSSSHLSMDSVILDMSQDFPILELSIFKPGYEVKHVKGDEMVRYNSSGNCMSMKDK